MSKIYLKKIKLSTFGQSCFLPHLRWYLPIDKCKSHPTTCLLIGKLAKWLSLFSFIVNLPNHTHSLTIIINAVVTSMILYQGQLRLQSKQLVASTQVPTKQQQDFANISCRHSMRFGKTNIVPAKACNWPRNSIRLSKYKTADRLARIWKLNSTIKQGFSKHTQQFETLTWIMSKVWRRKNRGYIP